MMLSHRSRCVLHLIVTFCIVTTVGNFNIDFLISRAEIYYAQPFQQDAPSEVQLERVAEILNKTDFKMIIHGYTGSRFHGSIVPLQNAYMAKGYANLLLADWSDAASLDYHSSRKAIGKVAKVFGKLLKDFMTRFQIDPQEVHVIGHSLGAHIAGGIGEYFNGTLSRVTGLDPALPLFSPYSEDSLQSTAAMFVDVIHTDFPVFGDITPRGIADFYPNYGQAPQRGCDDFDLIAASKLIFEAYSCSHNRAVLLYAESIVSLKSFPSLPCSLNAIRHRNAAACLDNLQANVNVDKNALAEAIMKMDDSQVVYMGEDVTRGARGIYFLDTYHVPPFGMGMNSKF